MQTITAAGNVYGQLLTRPAAEPSAIWTPAQAPSEPICAATSLGAGTCTACSP